MEREVGGGIGMGNTCKPMAVSFQCMTKSTTNKKKKKKKTALAIQGFLGASLVAQSVKNLPAMQETWVQFPGQEDPLEKEMATPWTEEPGGLQSTGSQELDMT